MSAAGEIQTKEAGGVFGFARLGELRLAIPCEAAEEVIRGPIALTRLPTDSVYLQGVFSLRGLPVPVLDFWAATGERRVEGKGDEIANAFVLQWQGQRFAIEISEISGVRRCAADSLTPLDAEEDRGVFDRLHTDAATGEVSAVVDVAAILKLEGMRASLSNRRSSGAGSNGAKVFSRGGSVVFRCGEFRFAMDCCSLKWVEKMSAELESPVSSEVLLGFQRQRNSEGYMAVLDLLAVLGMGSMYSEFGDRSVVVAGLGGKELGLSVDEVVEIRNFSGLERHEVDAMALGGVDLFGGSVIDVNGGEVFLIDPEKLANHGEQLGLFSQLIDSSVSTREGTLNSKLKQYVIYRVENAYFATLLEELDAVIDVPKGLVGDESAGSKLRGMCSYLGRPVRVRELREGAEKGRGGQLILLREGSSFVGFRVDQVLCMQWGEAEALPRGQRGIGGEWGATHMLSLERSKLRASASVVSLLGAKKSSPN